MNKHEEKFDAAMAVTFLIISVLLLIIAGHLSAVVSADNFQTEQLVELTTKHIQEHPFDVLHFNLIVFSVLGFGVVMMIIMAVSKPVVPKAEMKGEEHGSNDFQTRAELDEFIHKNTTEIFDLENFTETKGKKK